MLHSGVPDLDMSSWNGLMDTGALRLYMVCILPASPAYLTVLPVSIRPSRHALGETLLYSFSTSKEISARKPNGGGRRTLDAPNVRLARSPNVVDRHEEQVRVLFYSSIGQNM